MQFQFFDVSLQMNSDSSTYTSLFESMYARFKGNETFPGNELEVAIKAVPTGSSDPQFFLSFDGQSYAIDKTEVVEGYIYEQILRKVVSSVRSHILVHAGAVTTNGCGIILAGDCCHGKTTLVLELVRRGFLFLSDEMAALGRSDHRVHPFPRSLRIRHQTLELIGLASPQSAVVWLDKLILDIERIKPRCMGSTAPISYVVILKDGIGTSGKETTVPDFKSQAKLIPISTSQCVLELLKRFQGGSESAVLHDEHRGSAVRLFQETGHVISGAQCCFLQVGTLAAMADLVCEMCGHVTWINKSTS